MFDPADLLTKSLSDASVRAELAKIDAAGEYSDLAGSYYWQSRPAGLALVAAGDAQTITTVFFYAEGVKKYEQYAGALPKGLKFGMTRDDVRQLLGQPDLTRPALDRYNRDTHDLAAEYSDDRVNMVLVTTK